MDTISQINGRHASNLHRYATGTLNRILKIVEQVGARATGEILAIVEGMSEKERQAFIAGSYTGRRSKQLKDAINGLAQEIRNETSRQIRQDSKDLAAYEIAFTSDLLTRLKIVEDFTPVTVDAAFAAAITKPALGYLLADELRSQYQKIKRELNSVIRQGFVSGETNAQIIRRIRGTKAANYTDGLLGGPVKTNISRIVRTNTNHFANVARERNLEAMGIRKVQWRSTLDGRTSKICASRDLRVYPINEGPRPPAHPNCRSIVEPYIPNFEGRRPFVAHDRPLAQVPKDQRNVGQVNSGTNYSRWFANQSAAFQLEWLGPTRYKLYRSGKFPITRFVDHRTGREYNIDQLRSFDAALFEELGI